MDMSVNLYSGRGRVHRRDYYKLEIHSRSKSGSCELALTNCLYANRANWANFPNIPKFQEAPNRKIHRKDLN
jgi:hypothetical protein